MSIEHEFLFTVLMALVSFAGSWGGAAARLKRNETDIARAHERIDEHLDQHLEGVFE